MTAEAQTQAEHIARRINRLLVAQLLMQRDLAEAAAEDRRLSPNTAFNRGLALVDEIDEEVDRLILFGRTDGLPDERTIKPGCMIPQALCGSRWLDCRFVAIERVVESTSDGFTLESRPLHVVSRLLGEDGAPYYMESYATWEAGLAGILSRWKP